MKVLYVNSGPSPFHESLDRYIDLTLSEMDVDYRLFDLTAHIKFFDIAFDHVRQSYDIDYSADSLHTYASAALLQVVSEFEPDIVLTIRGSCIPASIVCSIKKMGVATALWVVDDPFEIDSALEYAGVYDYVFTVEANAVDVYRQFGCANVFHLPFAAFPKVHKKMSVSHYESDVCLVGSGLFNRIELVDEIAEHLVKSGLKVRIVGQWWDSLKSFSKLKDVISNKVVYAADAAKYYAGAKININIHRSLDDDSHYDGNKRRVMAFSPNAKTFEIAACGRFQLVDTSRADLGKYFDIGREIDVFSSPDELVKKIDHYLKNEKKREEMAGLAKERCLHGYTYRERLQFILETTLKKDSANLISDILLSANGSNAYIHNKDNAYYQKINRSIIQAVPSTAKRVLSIGCGEGLLGEMLKSLGVKEVYGVEVKEAVADRARGRLEKVIVGDIEEIELPFRNGFFDFIIYGDVLERLHDPWRVLAKQRRFLSANGQILAALPNTLYFPVIKDLLKGHWHYEKDGVLDTTNLRFFTLREIVHMFRWAGYQVEQVEGLTNGLTDFNEAHEFIKRLKPLDIVPESFAAEVQYAQYVVVAKKAKADSRQGAGLCLVKK